MNNPLKIFSVISIIALVFNVFFTNSLAWQTVPEAMAQTGDMCQETVPVDMVLVMDVSGSMAEGGSESRCQWQHYEETATSTWEFKDYLELGISQDDCNNICLNPDTCHTPVYTPGAPNKIESAKTAANNFLSDLGLNDQSALVSFSDTASLVNQLSSDHANTKSVVDGLTTNGATNIGGAIEFASGELGSSRANPQAVKAMILLTDGKANKPNGDGLDENSADVSYAETMAAAAAAQGYKIFTIGLGTNGDINETMLQNIASLTNAQYYHANNGDNLDEIYNLIAFEVCQYTPICGNFVLDIDNSAGEICDDGNLINGDGCDSTCQTEPEEPPIITTSTDNNVIFGFTWWDIDGLASTTNDWQITSSSDITINLYIGTSTVFTTTTDINGRFEFNNLAAGSYSLIEIFKSGWTQLLAPNQIELVGTSTVSGNNDFINVFTATTTNATTTTTSTPPETGGGGNTGGGGGGDNFGVGGGGSILPIFLTISNETSTNINADSVTISWQTNLWATSRVIYNIKNGDAPCVFDSSINPNFSFASSTIQNDALVAFREVALTGLSADTTYCYRVISHVSLPETISPEYVFHTAVRQITPLGVNDAQNPPINEPEGSGIGGGDEEENITQNNIATSTAANSTDQSGQVLGAEEQNGDIAGALELCKKFPNILWIILAIIYLLMLGINHADKIKKGIREKFGSYFNWSFAALPLIAAALAMILCGVWVWWLWILMIIFYLFLIIYYFVKIDSSAYWRVSIVITLFMAAIAWIARNCIC